MVTAGLTLALFTGVPVGTWLGGAYDWRATFWPLAAVGSRGGGGLAGTAPQLPGEHPAPLGERLVPLHDPAVARLVGTMFLCGSGGLIFYSYLGPPIVLVLPPTAIATAWADLEDQHHPVLEVLLRLPVTVVDVLDGERARAVGGLGGPQLEAHAVACSLDRGWPLVTTDPARYAVFGDIDTG